MEFIARNGHTAVTREIATQKLQSLREDLELIRTRIRYTEAHPDEDSA